MSLTKHQGFTGNGDVVSQLGCTTSSIGYTERCTACGCSYPWGSHHYCTFKEWNMTPSDYVPELGRKLSQEPCGDRHKDGPTTCTLPKGHDGKHSAPVRWDHW